MLVRTAIDHIIALKHGGKTRAENLAFSCLSCNRYKGSDLATIDPVNDEIVPLFNPRRQVWDEHLDLLATILDFGYRL